MQDGSACHFEKSQDRHISAIVCPIATKSGTVTHIVLLTVLTVKILKFKKSTILAVAILTKMEKSPV